MGWDQQKIQTVYIRLQECEHELNIGKEFSVKLVRTKRFLRYQIVFC